MNWLKRYRRLFKDEPESATFDIDDALERLTCNRCDGPLSASLVPLNDHEEVWDFTCKDPQCRSHLEH